MATQEKTWNVANRLHSQKDSDNPEVNHIIAGADEIYDDAKGAKQSDINAQTDAALADRYTKTETYSKEQLNSLITTPDVNHVSVVATDATTDVTDVLPATGEADTIYRVGNWNGTQYDPTMYALCAWNGSAYVCLAVRSFVGEVYDISANHPDGQGNPTPYADLAAALGTNGANVPESLRKGGMSIKFIQGTVQSSDNKYVQYRYMGTAVTGNPIPFLDTANWQGVDANPVRDSRNLIESGAVKAVSDEVYVIGGNGIFKDNLIQTYRYINSSGEVAIPSASSLSYLGVTDFIPVRCFVGEKAHLKLAQRQGLFYVAFYDEDKVVLSSDGTYNNYVDNTEFSLTIPEGAYYMRATMDSRRDTDYIKFEKNILLDRLTEIVPIVEQLNNVIGAGYLYVGRATTSTNPGTPLGKVFYIATAEGTYTNFGGLAVTQGINFLKYNGSAWSVESVWDVEDDPHFKSDKLVKGRGVFNALEVIGGNGLFKNDLIQTYRFINSSGDVAIPAASLSYLGVTDYIPVYWFVGQKVYLRLAQKQGLFYFAFYNEDRTVLSVHNDYSDNVEFNLTIPEGAYYIRVTMNSNRNTDYIKFEKDILKENYTDAIKPTVDKLNNCFLYPNLLNKLSLTRGRYLTANESAAPPYYGTNPNNTINSVSDFIPISAGQSISGNCFGSQSLTAYRFYDSEKQYIANHAFYMTDIVNNTIVAPNTASIAYIRITLAITKDEDISESELMINYGNSLLPYVEYGKTGSLKPEYLPENVATKQYVDGEIDTVNKKIYALNVDIKNDADINHIIVIGQSLALGQMSSKASYNNFRNSLMFTNGVSYSISSMTEEDLGNSLVPVSGGSKEYPVFSMSEELLNMMQSENGITDFNDYGYQTLITTYGFGGQSLAVIASRINSIKLIIKRGMELANAMGKTYCLAAVGFVQGEADRQATEASANTYYNTLNSFFDEINSYAKNVTGIDKDVQFVTYQTSSWYGYDANDKMPRIPLQLLKIATDKENCCMGAATYNSLYVDRTHMETNGYRMLGAGLGAAAKRRVIDGKLFKQIYCKEHHIYHYGSKWIVELQMNVPVEPLVFDHNNPITGQPQVYTNNSGVTTQIPFEGFEFMNSDHTQYTDADDQQAQSNWNIQNIITAVSIKRGNVVNIECNADPTGMELWYARMGNQGGGFLRDSQGNTVTISNSANTVMRVDNWCPMFMIQL